MPGSRLLAAWQQTDLLGVALCCCSCLVAVGIHLVSFPLYTGRLSRVQRKSLLLAGIVDIL